MDDEPLRPLYHRLFSDPSLTHTRDCTFCEAIVLLIFFYAVATHHSPRWAQRKEHWPIWCRRLSFPSYSQLMKRLKLPATQQRIEQLNREMRHRLARTDQAVVDGKPLVVGGYSKDRDAHIGKVPDGWARGYKLHALVDSAGPINAFDITALDEGEPTVMRHLLRRPGIELDGVKIRGDSNYDSNALYCVVARKGGRLVASRKKPGSGLGHHRHHPHRLQAIAELEGDPIRLTQHKRERARAEQSFAHLTNLPCGLWALPNFVRGRQRVRRWITAKILLYHLHLILARAQATAA